MTSSAEGRGGEGDEPVSRTCGRWMKKAMTDTLAGTEGVLDHYSRDVALSSGDDVDAVFRRLEEQLMTYRIFPPRLMRAEVCSEDGRIREGITIVQNVALGPLALKAAVRVVRVWRNQFDGAQEIGFTYATLQGHPERGISTFRLRRSTDRHITFLIDARSRPGSLLTLLARPFARRFQRKASEAALEYFTGPLSLL